MTGAQTFKGLVEQQHRRVARKRAADGQHLLLAAGQLVAGIAAPLRPGRETTRKPSDGPAAGPRRRPRDFPPP